MVFWALSYPFFILWLYSSSICLQEWIGLVIDLPVAFRHLKLIGLPDKLSNLVSNLFQVNHFTFWKWRIVMIGQCYCSCKSKIKIGWQEESSKTTSGHSYLEQYQLEWDTTQNQSSTNHFALQFCLHFVFILVSLTVPLHFPTNWVPPPPNHKSITSITSITSNR